MSSFKEPLPGWVDNMNGPIGLSLVVGKGVLRVMRGDNSTCTDLMTADIVCNALIAIPWKEACTNDM